MISDTQLLYVFLGLCMTISICDLLAKDAERIDKVLDILVLVNAIYLIIVNFMEE